MSKVLDILMKYTSGEVDLEKTNEALKAAGAGFHLDPKKNALTEEEIRATTIGTYPDMANGWGLLDTGTGSMDKVEVRKGILKDTDLGSMKGIVVIAGRSYYVDGAKLVDKEPDYPTAGGPKYPDHADMRRRTDLAGQEVEQRTVAGLFVVTYDEDGYAVKATRKK